MLVIPRSVSMHEWERAYAARVSFWLWYHADTPAHFWGSWYAVAAQGPQ